MKKTGIVLTVLMFAGLFSFLSITPREKAEVKPVKITKNIPAPVSGKPSNEGIAAQNLKLSQGNESRKSLELKKINDSKKSPESANPNEANVNKRVYTIQTGAFKNLYSAVTRALNLKRLGHNSFYNCETAKGKEKLYKVYVELFPSKEEAKQKALVLKTSGLINDFFIRAINEISRTAAGDCEPGTTIYFLHVSSYKQKIYAEKEVQKLKKYGYNAFTILQDVDGVSWFRVYTGEFDSEDKARKLGSELKEKGLSSYFKPISIDKIIKPSGIDALTFLQQSASLRQHEKSIPPEPAEPELIKHARPDQKISEEVIEKDKLPLVISDITFSAKKGEKELVLLHVNRYFSPSVLFNLEEEKPTIVIDVEPPASVKNVQSKTPVKGKWIKQIETQSNSNSKTLRIIVYLHASENYKVSQSFYRSEKIFAIKVTAKEKARKK